jgi:hypothetical protein
VERLRRPVLCGTTRRGNQARLRLRAAGAGADLRPAAPLPPEGHDQRHRHAPLPHRLRHRTGTRLQTRHPQGPSVLTTYPHACPRPVCSMGNIAEQRSAKCSAGWLDRRRHRWHGYGWAGSWGRVSPATRLACDAPAGSACTAYTNDVPLQTVANRSVPMGCGPNVDQTHDAQWSDRLGGHEPADVEGVSGSHSDCLFGASTIGAAAARSRPRRRPYGRGVGDLTVGSGWPRYLSRYRRWRSWPCSRRGRRWRRRCPA